jgi:hypothetical protein
MCSSEWLQSYLTADGRRLKSAGSFICVNPRPSATKKPFFIKNGVKIAKISGELIQTPSKCKKKMG